MKRYLRELLNPRVLVIALLAIFLGLFIYRWNAETVAGNKMPMPFGVGAAVVLSGSMEPALSVDDLVIVRKTDELAVGKIIVYQDGRMLTVHRIIAIEGDTVITMGDANNAADAPISIEAVKGEVVMTIPFAGLLVDFLREPLVVLLILGVAVFLIERSYRKGKTRDANELDDLKREIRQLEDELKK